MSKASSQGREAKRLARKRKKSEIRAAQYKASAERKRNKGEKKVSSTQHVGRASYSHAIADARKEQRHLDAQERQEYHNGLTVKEKIAKAQSRRGESKSEIARLTPLLEVKVAPRAKK